MKYDTNYDSKKYYVGATFATNSCGNVEILGKVYRKGKSPQYVFRFIDTGTIGKTEGCNISRGNVRDFLKPTVRGVGYIGYGSHKTGSRGRPNKMYTLWDQMLNRCYGTDPKFNSYKEQGITVCDRWKCFQSFCDDLPKIRGYALWLKGGYSIDKDKSGKKLYSLETVEFVSISENSKERQVRRGNRIAEQIV